MTCYNVAWKGRTRLIWCDTQCRSNWAWQIGLSLKYWITCPPCKVWPIPFKSWPSILAFLGLIDLVARGLCSKLLPLIHKNVLQAFLLARLGCPQNMESCVNFYALQSGTEPEWDTRWNSKLCILKKFIKGWIFFGLARWPGGSAGSKTSNVWGEGPPA